MKKNCTMQATIPLVFKRKDQEKDGVRAERKTDERAGVTAQVIGATARMNMFPKLVTVL
jgi:hypothetical protein